MRRNRVGPYVAGKAIINLGSESYPSLPSVTISPHWHCADDKVHPRKTWYEDQETQWIPMAPSCHSCDLGSRNRPTKPALNVFLTQLDWAGLALNINQFEIATMFKRNITYVNELQCFSKISVTAQAND